MIHFFVGYLPQLSGFVCATRTRLFRLINRQNGALPPQSSFDALRFNDLFRENSRKNPQLLRRMSTSALDTESIRQILCQFWQMRYIFLNF
jgi:hypothetical protein